MFEFDPERALWRPGRRVFVFMLGGAVAGALVPAAEPVSVIEYLVASLSLVGDSPATSPRTWPSGGTCRTAAARPGDSWLRRPFELATYAALLAGDEQAD